MCLMESTVTKRVSNAPILVLLLVSPNDCQVHPSQGREMAETERLQMVTNRDLHGKSWLFGFLPYGEAQ